MDALIGTFHIDWKIIIAQAVNFAIVLFVIYRFAIKPLGKLMNERASKIEKGLADAKVQAELVMKAESEYEARLAQARKEGQEVIAEVKKEAALERGQETEKTKKEVTRMIDEGKKQIELEKNKMMAEVKSEISELVIKATEKVLSGSVTHKVDTMLVEGAIKELK